MDILLMIYLTIIVIGVILSALTILAKNSNSASIYIALTSMLTGFIGFMTYSSMPSNFPNRRILALVVAIMCVVPFILDILNNKFKLVKPIFIKTISILVLLVNIILMLFL